ncbi:M48 family metallopeptidase [Rufibacter roseolus]|uniref:M48 family metallopeptidase n=1 Tax=Rufibacter roseolus TaxID=2817375 RepID=UPI001B309414|nr:M48 family metallopeptidase [Rufibacter roseolus]
MNPSFPYPPMPQGGDERVIAPSAEFKKEVVKVAGAIAFFGLVYVALMAAAVGLAVLCGYAGVALVLLKPAFFTLMIGLGLVGLGLMVLFFLLKFIFKRSKMDRSGMVEITEAEQPELFSFVRKITQETQTPFPKKIYLSDDVNAAVFYDSNFWSMFLPVKKNLVIGLGLVNSVNVTEFKAILAHEFGHFSQRSMKLGSYVYNVNKAIHNMLFDNEGYGNTLRKWSELSWYFALFATLTVKIVQGIQWILQKAYVVVNKPYMSLSRQMEFHADSVAAFVTGSEPLITSLRRIEAADICYSQLFNQYNAWLQENLKADNMYPQHQELMHRFAADFNIPMAHGLLQVNAQSLARFSQSRLVIKDQWASHPSTDDREAHLLALNIPTVLLHDSAWVLFRGAEQVQQQMTNKIYDRAKFEQAPQTLNLAAFTQKIATQVNERSLDKAYQGFYDDRTLKAFELEVAESLAGVLPSFRFEDLFTEANCKLPEKISQLERDLNTSRQLLQGEHDIKTFDFDGQKFSIKEASTVQAILEKELEEAQAQLDTLDKQVYQFFVQQAPTEEKKAELTAAYRHLFAATAEAEEDTKRYQHIYETLRPVFEADMSVEKAKATMGEVKQQEDPLKERLRNLLQEPTFARCLTPDQQIKLENYTASDYAYFTEEGFDNTAISSLTEALDIFVNTAWEKCFQLKKEMLALQITLLPIRQEESVAGLVV